MSDLQEGWQAGRQAGGQETYTKLGEGVGAEGQRAVSQKATRVQSPLMTFCEKRLLAR